MKIGLIGAGAIARRAHLPAWRSLDNDVFVVALADTNAQLAEKVAKEFDVGRWTVHYQEILSDPNVDVIDICTPTPTHFDIVMDALTAGKHVVVEKPLVLSLDHAFTIYKKTVETQKSLCVVQNYRYMEVVGRTKARLNSGALGRLISIHGDALTRFPSIWTLSTWLYHPSAVLYDFAPHLVDLVLWLHQAQVKNVFAVGREYGNDAPFLTSVEAMLEFEDGCVGMLDFSWLTSAFLFTLELHGTGGTIVIEPMREIYREIHGSITPLDDMLDFMRKTAKTFGSIICGSYFMRSLKVYRRFFQDFITSTRSNSDPPVTIEQSMWTIIILEALWRSIRTKRVVNIDDLMASEGLPVELVYRLRSRSIREAPL
jgi:predicted dehydrogenase